jgi:Tfp pilus assembly protein PilF
MHPQPGSSCREAFARAVLRLRKALCLSVAARTPDSALAFLNRGLILLRHGKTTEAQRDFTHALELRPDMKAYFSGRIECAGKELHTKSHSVPETAEANPEVSF